MGRASPLPSSFSIRLPYTYLEFTPQHRDFATMRLYGDAVYFGGYAQPFREVAIYRHDLKTDEESLVASPSRQDRIIGLINVTRGWLAYDDLTPINAPMQPDDDIVIYLLNLTTQERIEAARINEGGKCKQNWYTADFDGERLVWNQSVLAASGRCIHQIALYDIASRRTSILTECESPYGLDTPRIHGDRVVWNRFLATERRFTPQPTTLPGAMVIPGGESFQEIIGDVYLYDLRTGTEVNVSQTGKACQPDIWGDYVVWVELPIRFVGHEYGSGDIILHNLATKESKKITNNPLGGFDWPTVGDGIATWHQMNVGTAPIYRIADGKVAVLDQKRSGGAAVEGKVITWLWTDPNDFATRELLECKEKIKVAIFP
ncbi:MAG: hypothetical protein AB1566_10505 [Chloroflexota bacterium]